MATKFLEVWLNGCGWCFVKFYPAFFSRRNNEFMMVINANPGSRTQVEQAESILEVVAARHSSDSHIATIIYNNHICLCNLQQITIGACFALWDLGMSRIPRIGITSSISTSRTRLRLMYPFPVILDLSIAITTSRRSSLKLIAGDWCLRVNPNGVDLNRNWDEHWEAPCCTVDSVDVAIDVLRCQIGLGRKTWCNCYNSKTSR